MVTFQVTSRKVRRDRERSGSRTREEDGRKDGPGMGTEAERADGLAASISDSSQVIRQYGT